MIPVSNAFKNAIANDNRNYIIKINMTLNDGTELVLDNSDIWNGGLTFEEATSGTSSFDIGAVVIGKCQIVLNNIYDKFTEYDFFNATFWLYFGLQFGETTEIIRKGFYTVDEPKYNGSLITLSSLDNMWKFDVPCSEVSTAYPAAIGVIISDICAHCGVSLGKANFPNYNYVITERPDSEMNCREVISYLAQISCLYARISHEGMLVMQWYDSYPSSQNINGGYFDDGTPLHKSGDDLDGGTFEWNDGDDYDGGTFEDWEKIHVIGSTQSMSVSTDDIVITGIRALSSNSNGYDVLCGTEDYVLVIKDNPFVNIDNAEEVTQYVGLMIIGMYFRPFTASTLNDVTIEAGDMCVINDFRGNVYYSYITNLAFTIGSYESLSCGAETPGRNKTVRYSESAKTAAQIKKDTQEQISNYDKAVQNMNQLAMNAMGFFASTETLEDGSTIAYLHNKPTREESSTIYKMTSDGFFVSRDGGESYTSGFDAEGNAVLNMLSVIGIQFDWARGGTLSLGGDNNINGQINIFNSNGEAVGIINNNGIAIFSPTTQLQTIISPNVGFVLRDADGNEFYGMSFDKTEHLPAVLSSWSPSWRYTDGSLYKGYQNQPIKQSKTCYCYDDDSTSLTVIDTRKDESGIFSDYRYRVQYHHSEVGYPSSSTKAESPTKWDSLGISSKSITDESGKRLYTYSAQKTSIALQLPESFKGKNISINVLVEYKNPYKDLSKESDVFAQYSHAALIWPKCYEGLYVDTDWYSWAMSPDFIKNFEALNINVSNAPNSPHINPNTYVPDSEREIYTKLKDFPFPDNFFDFDYSYSLDNENAIITVEGWAIGKISSEYPNTDFNYYRNFISMNEFMRFRVMATC